LVSRINTRETTCRKIWANWSAGDGATKVHIVGKSIHARQRDGSVRFANGKTEGNENRNYQCGRTYLDGEVAASSRNLTLTQPGNKISILFAARNASWQSAGWASPDVARATQERDEKEKRPGSYRCRKSHGVTSCNLENPSQQPCRSMRKVPNLWRGRNHKRNGQRMCEISAGCRDRHHESSSRGASVKISGIARRAEERRVGKECRSRWS